MSVHLVTDEGRRIEGETAMDLLRALNERSLAPEADAWRYMVAMNARMRRLRGRGLDTRSPEAFLRDLHRAGLLENLRLGATAVDAAELRSWLRKLADLIRRTYVFPFTAEALGQLVDARARAEDLEAHSLAELSSGLEALLRSRSRDLHFAVEPLDPRIRASDAEARRKARLQRMEAENFGIRAGLSALRSGAVVARVGKLSIDYFGPLEASKAAISEAMARLAPSRTLIVDLRACRGGAPETIAWVSSYLFDAGRSVHLNDIHHRDGRVDAFHTEAGLPDPVLGSNLPVALLVGPATFSGGEEFAWNLQALGRARVIGQPSRGAAHPSAWHVVGGLRVRLPFARSINPYTGTNWEGRGVMPEIRCRAERAEAMARLWLGC